MGRFSYGLITVRQKNIKLLDLCESLIVYITQYMLMSPHGID